MITARFISRTVRECRESDPYKTLLHVINMLFKKGIKCNYDPIANDENRILLYSNRYNLQNYTIARECNGLILDYKTWQVVCYPPELANAKYDLQSVKTNFAEYDIFKLEDGTILNLYYYSDKWVMSTTKGIDVGNLEWCGITYNDAFNEASKEYKNFDLSKLDTKKCYTVGIRHPKMHPYANTTKMWFVSSYNIADGMRLFSEDIGIPCQNKCDVKSFDGLYDTKEPDHFGYILRSRNPRATHTNSTILLESPIMKNIRQLFYDRKLGENANILGLDRQKYILTLSFIEKGRLKNFQKLFPKFTEMIDVFQQKKISAIDNIYDRNPTCDFERTMISEIEKIVNLSKNKIDKTDIDNFICNKDYVVQWYGYLY